MNDKMRNDLYDKIGDDLTVYDIKRIEGMDWAADIYLRENLDAKWELEKMESTDSHYIEFSLDNCGGKEVNVTMNASELDQLTKMLAELNKEYKKVAKKIKAD